MQEVAQGRDADNAQVPSGSTSVSVQGNAGTTVSLAAPSLGLASASASGSLATGSATLNGGIIVPQCSRHALNSYYATDHLGTVRFVKTIDETGTEVATSTHDYEPFGVEITPADACDNTHKFTGHERDIETGNDYMHFRFYGASIGRFQKPDSNFDSPIANPQGWNLYSYVKGNPVNFNDPTGHQAVLPSRKGSGPDWAPLGHMFDDYPSVGIQETFGAANTLSNLRYQTTGQAANQPAQPVAQGSNTMFGANPFHLEPLKFTPPKGAVLGIHGEAEAGAEATSGHAWLTVTEAGSGVTHSYSTYPDGCATAQARHEYAGSGTKVRKDWDLNLSAVASRYYILAPDQAVSLMINVSKYSDWSYSHNCVDWATGQVTAVTGENFGNLSDPGMLGFSTPRMLTRSILNLEAKQPASAIAPLRTMMPASDDNGSSSWP